MAKVFVTFEVSIRKDQYSYSSGKGSAEAAIHVDRRLVYTLDPGNIFRDLVHTALVEFDSLPKPENDEDK